MKSAEELRLENKLRRETHKKARGMTASTSHDVGQSFGKSPLPNNSQNIDFYLSFGDM